MLKSFDSHLTMLSLDKRNAQQAGRSSPELPLSPVYTTSHWQPRRADRSAVEPWNTVKVSLWTWPTLRGAEGRSHVSAAVFFLLSVNYLQVARPLQLVPVLSTWPMADCLEVWCRLSLTMIHSTGQVSSGWVVASGRLGELGKWEGKKKKREQQPEAFSNYLPFLRLTSVVNLFCCTLTIKNETKASRQIKNWRIQTDMKQMIQRKF